MKKAFSLFIFLVLGFGAIFAMSNLLEKNKLKIDERYSDEDLYLSSQKLNLLGSDFKGLIADWYWIQSLQYMGNKIINSKEEVININDLRPLNPRLLFPMLDTASSLDPQFMTVYSYGAAVLPAIDSDQAIKLLEKGVAANREDWRLYHNLGYIYWQSKNYSKAAEVYAEGAKKPGAPVWMKQMSVNMQAQGGSRDFARQIYQQMFDTAEDEQAKTFAELRFAQIQSLDERDAIRTSLQIFQRKFNRCPQNWREVSPYLQKTVPPYGDSLRSNRDGALLDPTGVPYVMENQNNQCDVNLSKDSKIPRF
jgi:tetratricopeptide (TPR) repeat protein